MDGFASVNTTTKPILGSFKPTYQQGSLAPLNGLQALHKEEGQRKQEQKKQHPPFEENDANTPANEEDKHVQQLCQALLAKGFPGGKGGNTARKEPGIPYRLTFNTQQKQLQIWEGSTLLLAIEEPQLPQALKALKTPLPTGLLSSSKG
jgi:hypothetical protein